VSQILGAIGGFLSGFDPFRAISSALRFVYNVLRTVAGYVVRFARWLLSVTRRVVGEAWRLAKPYIKRAVRWITERPATAIPLALMLYDVMAVICEEINICEEHARVPIIVTQSAEEWGPVAIW